MINRLSVLSNFASSAAKVVSDFIVVIKLSILKSWIVSGEVFLFGWQESKVSN